jgi:tRNA pseudouridine(54/55) synthase
MCGAERSPPTQDGDSATSTCSICLGLLTKQFSESLVDAIKKAAEPYGDLNENRFSRRISPPMLILPGDIAYRYQVEAEKRDPAPASVQDFVQELKRHVKSVLGDSLDKLEGKQAMDGYPSCVAEEELGYLAIHVVAIPTKAVHRPVHMFPKSKSNKKGRKRNIHEDSQGGDPRTNLDRCLERGGMTLWSLNQALDSPGFKAPQSQQNDFAQLEIPKDCLALDFHVAVWRRPFYLRGMYTKTRRDVSQTPFHVVDEGKRRKLGATSVEEQISPAIIRACKGISTHNNDPCLENVVFGMAKFHASGREDIDVRMLLPEQESDAGAVNVTITGRPFVYEIFDALRLPSMATLPTIVREINHFTNDNSSPDPRSYGRNPMGVGISSDLNFVPSSSFKKLQDETEDKVKHYGCLCWSEKPLPSTDEDLVKKLGTIPLELHQRTPIRVLHRRTNTVRTRHVLSCRARRIDDHYFRLNISTSAGTYVKEFAHGDLGRTVPSVSALLGCNTDILELDCEGIQF